MNTTTKIVMTLPPIIISCLLVCFRNYLMPGDDQPETKEQPPQALTSPVENQLQDSQAKAETDTVGEAKSNADNKAADNGSDTPADTNPSNETSFETKTGAELLKELAPTISDNPLWKAFAQHPNALDVFVKATEQLANGNRPLAVATLEFLPKPTPFRANKAEDGSYIIAQETEQRFAPVIQAICSVPAEKAAELIKQLEPDFDAIIHDKLGYPPDTTFKKLYLESLTTILTTPVPEKPLQLVKLTDTLYKYAIPDLEELSEAQKFILRLGIANQTMLANYAKELWKHQ